MKEGFTAQNPMSGPEWDVERYAFTWLQFGHSIEHTITLCERRIHEGNFSRLTVRCPYHGNNIFWKRVCPLCNSRYRMCIDYLLSLKKSVREYCATRPQLVGLETWEIIAQIRDWTRTGRWHAEEARESSRPAGEQARSNVPTFSTTHRHAAAILGVSPDSPREILQVRFRELIKQYHPDSVHHLGHEFRVIAEEKAKEIIWAHQYLSSRHTEPPDE
jgi:hypothetical protein